jgi:N-acetylmuramoyl-L-alanine amidase
MGSQLLTAQANQRDNSVLVEIQIPAGIEYRTSTENGGLRAVLTIPNFITGVERKTFGSGGENISISSLVPLTYTSTQTGTVMEVVFNNILPGKAQTSYNFASSLISTMGFQKKTVGTTVQTVLTLTTTKTAKFAVGLSSNGSVLNIMFIDQSQIQPRIPMVVLDAGHGGRDPGANGFNLNEKDVNLAIVLKVGELLTQNGIKVVYTRKDDTYVDLDLRSSMANLYNAALFVSLHSNANLSPDPSGTETYYYAPLENPELYIQKDERSKLAACLQQSLVAKLGRNDRGIKQGNLSVLRETVMPSALIELAFISNPIEGELLKQQQFRDSAAQAIADGITGYMNNVNLDNVRP